MFHVVLYQPEIPSNAGNLIRLCANTGSELHLIEPLGFSLEDRQLRRAGLDYRDVVAVHVNADFAACKKSIGEARLATFSTHHQRFFTKFRFQAGDMLLFGPETRGLPTELAQAAEESARLTIPMLPANRSLNLSNAVAVVGYDTRSLDRSRHQVERVLSTETSISRLEANQLPVFLVGQQVEQAVRTFSHVPNSTKCAN